MLDAPALQAAMPPVRAAIVAPESFHLRRALWVQAALSDAAVDGAVEVIPRDIDGGVLRARGAVWSVQEGAVEAQVQVLTLSGEGSTAARGGGGAADAPAFAPPAPKPR